MGCWSPPNIIMIIIIYYYYSFYKTCINKLLCRVRTLLYIRFCFACLGFLYLRRIRDGTNSRTIGPLLRAQAVGSSSGAQLCYGLCGHSSARRRRHCCCRCGTLARSNRSRLRLAAGLVETLQALSVQAQATRRALMHHDWACLHGTKAYRTLLRSPSCISSKVTSFFAARSRRALQQYTL